MSEQKGQFETAVGALLDDFAGSGTFGGDELGTVVDGLSRYLRATVSGLDRDELAEIIDVALLEFLEAAQAGRIDRAQRPGGYLIRLARWRALDYVRGRPRRELPQEEVGAEEAADADLAADLVEALDSEALIAALLRRNRLAEEHELNAVIRAWLDLADRGEQPTVRAVAGELGIAPSTVSGRLAQIRAILVELGAV